MFPVHFVSGFEDLRSLPWDPDLLDEVEAELIAQGWTSLEAFQRARRLPPGLNPETLDALGVELR
jgi:hypothetical protein